MTELELKVLKKLQTLPEGKIITYAKLAKLCKIKNGARFIGNVMAKNMDFKKYPCYKVVHSNGQIGNYSGKGGKTTKTKLLKKEGIEIQNDKILKIAQYL